MSFFNTELNTNSINYDSVNGIIIKNADNTTGNISLSQSGIILTSNGGGSSKGIQFKSSDGDISSSNVWSINLFSNTDNDFSIWHNDNLRFFYKEDGLFVIKGQNDDNTSGLRIDNSGNSWVINTWSDGDLVINRENANRFYYTPEGLLVIKGENDSNTSGLRIDSSIGGGSWVINTWSDGDLVINRDNSNKFFYTSKGLFNIRTEYNKHYVDGSNKADSGLRLQNYAQTQNWTLNIADDNDLVFFYSGNTKGYLNIDFDAEQIDFTGQHRSLLNRNIDNSSIGLIVSSTGKYVNLDNTLNTNINESLPVCIITSNDNDKKVFGVLSDKEDSESIRSYSSGNWGSVYIKQNTNEQRMFINSVGEGGLWVCNKAGAIENGDYITSSTIPGYGMKQTDDLLHNYTVAKITCDCDFSITKIVKQKLKVILTTVSEEVETTDENGNKITTTQDKITTEIDYDANGDVQYEDDLDENGNQQMVYPMDTRFLLPDGTQITEEDYTTRLGNGETLYLGCFVGCTYHCG